MVKKWDQPQLRSTGRDLGLSESGTEVREGGRPRQLHLTPSGSDRHVGALSSTRPVPRTHHFRPTVSHWGFLPVVGGGFCLTLELVVTLCGPACRLRKWVMGFISGSGTVCGGTPRGGQVQPHQGPCNPWKPLVSHQAALRQGLSPVSLSRTHPFGTGRDEREAVGPPGAAVTPGCSHLAQLPRGIRPVLNHPNITHHEVTE